MAITNRERVRKGLDELKTGLLPFVERELKANLGGHWVEDITARPRFIQRTSDGAADWDTQALLKAMVDNWQGVFRYVLGHVERSYVGELFEARNKWAHEKPFTSDDVYRALDTMQRLLESISEGEPAEVVGELRADWNNTGTGLRLRKKAVMNASSAITSCRRWRVCSVISASPIGSTTRPDGGTREKSPALLSRPSSILWTQEQSLR